MDHRWVPQLLNVELIEAERGLVHLVGRLQGLLRGGEEAALMSGQGLGEAKIIDVHGLHLRTFIL